MKYQRPFLKWVGGKHRLLDKLNRKLPKGDRLVEPFVGSGAVFMGTDYDSYLLADSNPDLINLYRLLRDHREWFIDYVRGRFSMWRNTPEDFYSVRDIFNQTKLDDDREKRAALFVWLNRHGFNGLCRYNASGEFNVPFGRYKSIYFPEQEMRAFGRKLREREVALCCDHFTGTLLAAKPGDVVYCDPPYAPLSDDMSFTTYTPDGFGWSQQVELGSMVTGLSMRGIPVVVSNHSNKILNRLYREAGASLSFINGPRSISCKEDGRKPAREVLAYWRAAA